MVAMCSKTSMKQAPVIHWLAKVVELLLRTTNIESVVIHFPDACDVQVNVSLYATYPIDSP